MPSSPTPADLRLVALLASDRDPSGDPFRDAARARGWCEDHALDPGRRLFAAEDLARLRALRAALRGAIDAPDAAPARRLGGLATRARLEVVPGPVGPVLRSGATGVDATIGRLLLDATDATTRGTWSRIRVCASPGCGRVFLDTSRNGSRAWCDMATCGNRAKVRAHRERIRTGERA